MNLSRSSHKSRCAMNHMSPVHRLTDIHRNLQHSCRVRSYSSSGCVAKRELLRISHQRKIAHCLSLFLPSVLWRCWLGSRKGIRPVKNEWWGVSVVICLELGADLYMAQLMPLPLTVSCFSKIQIGFTFLVPAHPGSPGKRAAKRVCVCAFVSSFLTRWAMLFVYTSCPKSIWQHLAPGRPKSMDTAQP